ncbi:MAG: hypothetical protein NZ651_06130 [Candidatus Bipolaricaulota bacterium]|nr:hypothetical protein [Candidatus Bipolaricaulota bacterium]MDW8127331.1 hypothetical protein [Candidatus Bipolaricaulota bacterium]
MKERSWLLIMLGVIALVVGALLPFLMVLRIIASTLGLNFLAFACQVGGLFLGLIGLANYVRPGRRNGWQ